MNNYRSSVSSKGVVERREYPKEQKREYIAMERQRRNQNGKTKQEWDRKMRKGKK